MPIFYLFNGCPGSTSRFEVINLDANCSLVLRVRYVRSTNSCSTSHKLLAQCLFVCVWFFFWDAQGQSLSVRNLDVNCDFLVRHNKLRSTETCKSQTQDTSPLSTLCLFGRYPGSSSSFCSKLWMLTVSLFKDLKTCRQRQTVVIVIGYKPIVLFCLFD